ncbi:hypothetical protein D3C80_1950390 [compost metagenome]
MHIQRPLVSLIVIAPDLLNQPVARQCLPRIAGQLEQQLKFLERQRKAAEL